jgi:2',3'-cyclic-nucleotide 2'-phosphodiesterase/3'-nucleotidase
MSPANVGWARLATAIRAERAKGGATLLVDCGDALSGSPLAYIQNKMHPASPNVVIEIMNGLGYRAMAPGGRDFDFGVPALKSAEARAAFPFVAANVLDSKGNALFAPYAKVTIDGVSVALLGLSAPSPQNAANIQGSPGIIVRDAIETAKEWLPRLRKEKTDLVVVLMHAGQGRKTPGGENAAFALIDAVPGIDAVVASQSHRALATRYKGVPVVQPSPLGRSLASITLTLQRQGRQWTLKSSEPMDIPLDQTLDQALGLDPTVLRLTEALRQETEDYLNTFATRLGSDLDGRWSTVEPSALLQLIHDVQKKATGAQLSAAPSPGPHIFVEKGPTSVRQFYALAPHENRVAKIRVTGAQLRAYLEQAATYFNYSHLPELLNRSVRLEDYDVVDGCSYALDISRPPGKRVASLKYGGKPVEDAQTFTMAISSARLAGEGGYMDAMGFAGRAEAITGETLRNLLLEHVLASPSLDIQVNGDWRTIPFLDRNRVLGAYR